MEKSPEQIAEDRAFINSCGTSALAKVLNESDQNVSNWKHRGISKAGNLKIEMHRKKIDELIKRKAAKNVNKPD